MPLSRKKPKKAKPQAEKPSKRKVTKQEKPRKAAEKITPKKANKKKSTGVAEKKAGKRVKVIVPKKEPSGKRVYHVSKRSDGMWAVKFAGGEKAIKLFMTQAEAVDYTKKMSKNQKGAMLIHNSKGKNKGRIQ